MSKKKYKNCCKGVADQYLTLVTIYAAIINQQFDNADELEVLQIFDSFRGGIITSSICKRNV